MKRVIKCSTYDYAPRKCRAFNTEYGDGGMTVNEYFSKYGTDDMVLSDFRRYYRDEVDTDKYPTFMDWAEQFRADGGTFG